MIHVTKCVQIPEDAKNAMSIVAASDYEIVFREQNDLSEKLLASVEELNKQDEIIVLKKTKKKKYAVLRFFAHAAVATR